MHQVGFGAWNWVAVIGYLVIMLLIGAYFTKRAGKDTDSFFTASGRLPSWAIGFSIYATTLSAITFMSTPEKAFLTDWAYIAGNIAIIAIIPILIAFYVPFFKKVTRHISVRIFRGAFWPKYSCHWFITIRHFPLRTHSNCDLLTNISNHSGIRYESIYRS